jgi:hypothetical protein
LIAALAFAQKHTTWLASSTSKKRSTASRARSMIAVLARALLDSECGLPNTPVRKRRMCART